ncbi:Hsp20/alpha crystallin family protein [Natronobiforma cellulositropha]|uniref:Hsp20/alpha crystallin family protein n=1 Tax=Natronobiforma cellulositropha TaxID=1679076 RepID=UPI0021D5BD8B|nr:Hsp20/alpha crystallin family protein [Natronobiforma cellulositropha]
MRRNPFDELEELLDRVSRQVEEGMASGTGLPVPGSVAVDVADYDEEYVVTADLPGYETDDIELTLTEGTLRLEAERERETETADEEGADRYIRRERTSRSISRRFRLPEPVDEEGVSASYTNGVLTVTLPKHEPAEEESKRIDID